MEKQRTFVHYLMDGKITQDRPVGCVNPTKGSRIKAKGQTDVRIRICRPTKSNVDADEKDVKYIPL